MFARHDGIRRLEDGSIDFGFYRRRAASWRSRAMREFLAARVGPLVRPVVAAAVIAAALYVMPGKTGDGWNGPREGGGLTGTLPGTY
jgi:hypothetical protein